MPPQSIITNVQRNITPHFTYVHNQIAVQLPNEPIPQLEVLSFYVQIRRVITGLYKAILITGKDMLINEYKYTNLYRLYVQFIPALTKQYQYVEYEIKFDQNIKKQFDKLVTDLKYIFDVTRQLDDSPFAEIWLGRKF